MATTNYSWNLPTVGGSEDTWGTQLNANWTALDTLLGGVNATEVAILNGATVTTAELNKLDGLTATTAELNVVDGITSTTAELNKLDGFTGTVADLNYAQELRATGVTAAEFDKLDGLTATTAELNLLSGQTSLVPSGVIVMWSGSVASIPTGWRLCDGTNGTPNLQNRFIVGAGDSYAVGATGGADSVALSGTQIPSHTHSFSATSGAAGGHAHTASSGSAGNHAHSLTATGTTNTTGAHNHTYQWVGSGASSSSTPNFSGNLGTLNTSTAGDHSHTVSVSGSTNTTGAHTHTVTVNATGDHTHTVSGTTGASGSGASHENRPPYYALAYIMKA